MTATAGASIRALPSRLSRADARAIKLGLHASPWTEPRPGAHVARARAITCRPNEAGHGCPITMTFRRRRRSAASPSSPRAWLPRSMRATTIRARPGRREARPDHRHGHDREAGRLRRARQHDAREPVGARRPGRSTADRPQMVLLGADVRRLLVLAQARRALLFFRAALAPDGTQQRDADPAPEGQARQPLQRVQRSRIRGAWAWLVGDEGRGVRPSSRWCNYTRLDCVIGSPRGMRAAVAQAIPSCRHRTRLRRAADRAAADAERARRSGARIGGGDGAGAAPRARVRRRASDPHEARSRRIGTPVGKYWVCKRAPAHAPRRWNAWAATATSRKRRCRGSIARRRSTRSGRVGQRDVPRRAARDSRGAGGARSLFRRGRGRGRGEPRLSRRTSTR